jgi:hypothetical protein
MENQEIKAQTLRSLIEKASQAVVNVGPDSHKISYYSGRVCDTVVDNNGTIDSITLSLYKSELLGDVINKLRLDDKAILAECIYRIRGRIPDHLLKYGYFRYFRNMHPDQDPIKFYPMNLPKKTGFKAYCATLPLVKYNTWHGERRRIRTDYQYATLAFVIWADRFQPFLDDHRGRPEDVPPPFTNSNPGVLGRLSDEARGDRYRRFMEEEQEGLYASYQRVFGPRQAWPDYNEPVSSMRWYGSLIYQPNFNDPDELNEVMKRLVRTSRGGDSVRTMALKLADPLFKQFASSIKYAGSDILKFDVSTAGHLGLSSTPAKFKEVADRLRAAANLAEELSNHFQLLDEEGLIGKSVSESSLLGSLIAKRLLADPELYTKKSFRPDGWRGPDQLIYWAAKTITKIRISDRFNQWINKMTEKRNEQL